MLFLEIGQFRIGQASVLHVPAKGGKFHDHDHLGAGDIGSRGIVQPLAYDVTNRHVAHKEDEADPWHKRRIDLGSDKVGAIGTECQREEAIPQIK